MTSYRVYQLDAAGHIVHADWLEADTDEAAEVLALKLCGPGVPTVELWQAARRVSVLSCGGGEDEPGPGGRTAQRSAGSSAKTTFRQPAGRAADWLRLRTPQRRGRGGRLLVPGAAPLLHPRKRGG